MTQSETGIALPPDAPRFGKLEEVYPKGGVASLERKPWFAFGGAAFGFLLALVFFIVSRVAPPPADPEERRIMGYVLLFFQAGGAVLGIAFLVQGFLRLGKSTSAVGRYWFVFDGGLTVLDNGKVLGSYPLDTLRVIKHPRNRDSAYADIGAVSRLTDDLAPDLRLQDGNGNAVPTPIDKSLAAPIIRHLHKNISQNRLAPAQQAVASGHGVRFGAVEVRREGIVCEGKPVPFPAMKAVEFFLPNEITGGLSGLQMRLIGAGDTVLAAVDAPKQMVNTWLFVRLVHSLHPELIAPSEELEKLLL